MSYIGNTSTTQAFTPAIDYFSGNASTTAFTLSRPIASVAQIQVVVNNVAQNPSSAYTVSGNTITFTSAPSAGTNNIYVYYTSPITQVIAPGQNTVYPSSLSTTNALYWDTSGNVGIGNTTIRNKLDIVGNTGVYSTGATSAGSPLGAQVYIGDSNYNTAGYYNAAPGFGAVYDATYASSAALAFYTFAGTANSRTERMRIDSSGVITSGLGGMQVISGTSVTASGTSVNFTSIPSWVKRITVMFSGVSTNGTSNLLLQIGDSGGIENTGYTSCAQTDGGSSTVISSGFAVVYGVTAAGTNSGRIEISLITGTTWVASGVVGNNGGNVSSMFGNKALSDVLDRVRITTVAGTDTFDAGSINILYE